MRSPSRLGYPTGFVEQIVARVSGPPLLPPCCREVAPSSIMSGSALTTPDERHKREQGFRCPERARISWGSAMRRRVRGRDLSLSSSGQRHIIAAPWPSKFEQGPYLAQSACLTANAGDRPRRLNRLSVCALAQRCRRDRNYDWIEPFSIVGRKRFSENRIRRLPSIRPGIAAESFISQVG